MYQHDERVVLTLDAGGTNFVFSAIQGCRQVVEPISIPAVTHDIEVCLKTIAQGFEEVWSKTTSTPVAISFAFPGPADYERGIIGDAPNFPAFRGGVALGPYLQQRFNIPVFINNDGNLFAYGEALAGVLPKINSELQRRGGMRRYRNLLGVTIGTGFGGGVVIDGHLLRGDNGVGGDLYLMRDRANPEIMVEECVSIRAVKRHYAELSHDESALEPKDIFEIAEGSRCGNREAAVESFRRVGSAAGDAIVRALNLIDGLAVIGGGVMGASKYIMPAVLAEMRSKVQTLGAVGFDCMQSEVYNLDDEMELSEFLAEQDMMVEVPFSDEKVPYMSHRKVGVAVSELGTSRAVALGAYTYALSELDKNI